MMTATAEAYQIGDLHQFASRGKRFVYLVPAGAVFQLDEASAMVVDRLQTGRASHEELVELLERAGHDSDELLSELALSQTILTGERVRPARQELPENFPLMTLVINLTNHENVLGYDVFRIRDASGALQLDRTAETWFSLLPSVGLSWSRRF